MSMKTINQERRLSICSSDSGYSNAAFKNAENRTMQNYESSQDYIAAMTEDLSEWLNLLYETNLNVDNFFNILADGVLLCQHALEVQSAGLEYIELNNRRDLPMKIGNVVPIIPEKGPLYRKNAQIGSFLARDNISNFILWCRSFGIPASLTFETEDLVLVKNARSVIVCLLEIARIGAKFGMEVPDIVHLEEEIDAEIEADQQNIDVIDSNQSVDSGTMCDTSDCDGASEVNELDYEDIESLDSQGKVKRVRKRDRSFNVNHPQTSGNYTRKPLYQRPERGNIKKERPKVDMKSLDEMVREILAQCTCEETFPMKRVKEGKYLFGDKSTLIFVRILRNHVMVRVGGGWSTLNDFLEKYDACRKCNKQIITKISVPAPAASMTGANSKSDEASPSNAIPSSSSNSPQVTVDNANCEENIQQTTPGESRSKIDVNHLFESPIPGESLTATLDPSVILNELQFSQSQNDQPTNHSNISSDKINNNATARTSSKESSPNTSDKKNLPTVCESSTVDRKKSATTRTNLGRRSSMTTVDTTRKISSASSAKVNPPVGKKSSQSTQPEPASRPSSARNRSNSLFTTESPLAKNSNSLSSTFSGPINSKTTSRISSGNTTNSSTRSGLNGTVRTRAATTSQVPSKNDKGNESLSMTLPYKSSNTSRSNLSDKIELRRPSSALNSNTTPKSSKISSIPRESKTNSNRGTPERAITPKKDLSLSSPSNDLQSNNKPSRIPIGNQQFSRKPLINPPSASAPSSGSSSPASSRRNSITEKAAKSSRRGTYTPTKSSNLQNQKGQAIYNVNKAAQVLQESNNVEE